MNFFSTKITFLTLILLLLLFAQHHTRVYRPPPFFSAFFCQPGFVLFNVNTTVTCPTPKVIPKADKFGISLMQIGLNPVYYTGQIMFETQITSLPGTNITGVTINLWNWVSTTIEYKYIVIVVGYQPQNTWMDLVNVVLPNDLILNPLSTNTYVAPTPLATIFTQSFTYASKTKFASGTFNLIGFTSSFYAESTAVVGIKMTPISINSTHFKVQYQRSATSHRIILFRGTIVIYDPAAITAAGGDMILVPKLFISVNNLDYAVAQPLWGPKFDTKCIVGFNDINYNKNQCWTNQFIRTAYNNYYQQDSFVFRYATYYIFDNITNTTRIAYFPYNVSSSYFNFGSNFLCFTDKTTECGQLEIFYDIYTDTCLTAGTLCPVPTAIPAAPFTYPILCTNCFSIFCLTCQVSNRNNCTLCNSIYFRTNNSLGICSCTTGYYETSVGNPLICKINCTYHIPGCRLNSCTSIQNCTLCLNGFYLNPIGIDYNCLPCSSNCLLCTIAGCNSCRTGYVISSTALCDICPNLLKYCVTCTVYSACTRCQTSPTIFRLSNSLCKSCSDLEPNCTACNPDGTNADLLCKQCVYPLVPDITRLLCISCSNAIQDCVQCTYNSVNFIPKCTLCLPKFNVDDDLHCQSCKKGTWIQRECYYIIGCSSVSLIHGNPTCLACTQPHFQYHQPTGKCVCQHAYQLNLLDQTCLPRCGDGLRAFLDEECDDDNKFNGDGCSDQCKVQPDFFCSENSKTLSRCLYQRDIKVIFDYILKVENKNQAKIYFHVEPPALSVSKVDWSKATQFTFSDTVKTTTTYQNGILIITVDYENEVQGKDLQIDIMYDPKYIIASHQQLIFPMKAINGALSYHDKSQIEKDESVGTAGFVLGMICLVCYLLSTFFHKMIGLETLQFIQLIYFARIIGSQASQSSLQAFNSLRYSNGYNDIYHTGEIENAKLVNQIPTIFLNMSMKLYYLDNCNLMLVPIGLATLAYVYYSFKKTRTLKNYLQTKELFLKDEFFDYRRKVDLIYGNFIFSYILSLLYITIFSMLLYELSKTENENYTNYATMSFGTSLLIMFFIAIIFCSEAFNGIQKNFKQKTIVKENVFNEEKALERDANCENQDYHPLYVSVYLLYQLLIIVLINCIFADFRYLSEVMSVLATFYMIGIVIWRPYLMRIHNFAIVFNQAIVVMSLIFQLLDKHHYLNDTMMTVCLYLTISLIAVALFIQAARLYIQQSSPPQIFKKASELENQNRKKVDLKDEKNKYLIDNQIKKAIKENFKEEEMQGFSKPENFNREFRHKIMNKTKLKINIPTLKTVTGPFIDQINIHNEDIPQQKEEEDDNVDIAQVKDRLRRQLNFKRNKDNFF